MSAGTNDTEEMTPPPEPVERRVDEETKKMLERYEVELDRRSKESKESEDAPQEPLFVMRKKEDWSEIGWSEDAKKDLSNALLETFQLKPTALSNAIEIIVGNAVENGLSPEDVLARINRQAYNKFEKAFLASDNKRTERDAKRFFFSKAFKIDGEGELAYVEPADKASNGEEANIEGVKMGLKLNADYVTRFILNEDFHAELRAEANQGIPENIFENAWQIAFNQEEEFGLKGKFPMLQMQIEYAKNEDGSPKKDKDGNLVKIARYRINQSNFMTWIRSWIIYNQEKEPDQVTNYFNEIKIQNKSDLAQVTVGKMLDSQSTYFKDEDGNGYQELWDQTLLELYMMMTVRQYDIEYKQSMASEEKLAEAINKMFFLNTLTKKLYNKSMMYYLTTMGLDFKGKNSDSTLGSAWTTMYLTYYNLSDYEKVEEILGKDASFFTRKGLEEAMQQVVAKKYKQTEAQSLTVGNFMGSDVLENFEKAFTDKNGKKQQTIQDKEYFIKFINHFAVKRSNGNWVDVIKTAITNTVKETHDFKSQESNMQVDKETGVKDYVLDDASLNMAHLIAFSWQRFTGAGARNDTGVAGYDSATKWYYTELYRRKMATPERGGSFGNPYTVPMFKGTMVDFMRGIRVAEAETPVAGAKNRKKTPLEVFEEMHQARAAIKKLQTELNLLKKQRAPQPQIDVLQKQIDAIKQDADSDFRQKAGQLEFTDNTMRNYAGDHVDRTFKVYGQIMKADSINFDKFTKYDLYRGISFDRAAFQDEVQDKFLKPLRYMWETNGDMNFNMKVRYPVFKGRDAKNKDQIEYKEMCLGEALRW